MKRSAIIICALLAILSALAGLALLSPQREAQQRYYRAHNQIERIADRNESGQELKYAVFEERKAHTDLYWLQAMGRGCVWIAVLFSGGVLLIGVFSGPRKEPNQSADSTASASHP